MRHVEEEIKDLAEWLPLNLKNLRSTLRQKGAGNIVELDHGEKPPEHERQHVLHDEHENVDERNHEHNDGDVNMGEGDGMDDDDHDRHDRHDDHSLGRNMNQDQMNPGSSDSQGETTFQSSESDQDMERENNMPRHDTHVMPLHDMSQNLVGDGHVQNDNRGNNGGYG